MKIHKIENRNGEVFYVKNKKKFCEEMNLTPRLLDYTKGGFSREQEYHKDYKIVCKMSFIESEEGEKTLWDSGVKGYTVAYEPKPKSENIEADAEIVHKDEVVKSEEISVSEKELLKVMKQKQKLQDKITLLNKLMRENLRKVNFQDSINETLKEYVMKDLPLENTESNKSSCATNSVLFLSDLHLGQNVKENNNVFNSVVAKERLATIFDEFNYENEIRNICDITILLGGDLIFAQHKKDMLMSGELPELQSAIECFKILSYFIDDYIGKYNTITFAGVLGNESRVANWDYPSNLQSVARNNFDYLIFEMLKQRYGNYSCVNFVNNGDVLEEVVEVGGYHIAMVHGNTIRHNDLNDEIIKLKIRLENSLLSNEKKIDYVLLGHIHSSVVTDFYSRNSSLVGSNSYSNALNIPESRPSQTMLVIGENGIKAFTLNC